MKKIISIFSLVMVFVFGSCIEQNYPIWDGAEVEFQDAVTRAPAAGQTFPRIAVQNTVGTVNLQVNLVSAQRTSDETITYNIVGDGTSAVAGTHYNASGSLVIPANSSFGELEVEILDTGVGTGVVDLLLELEGNANISASENYKRVQIRISQPAPPAD
ncbi:DUF4843 domain-containing protein [Litoribacter ruber]|uniref:DUF4843 domain-containing protein n=1 Tax=Litoribacter ruber TaxID=702568 RepID=UPI001BD99A8E|nr:DUF4843 domain-containing protein [Litoribacter ruber]MBT0811977.1 DUF4843 domain-containing protein [Litoribacter ruber]